MAYFAEIDDQSIVTRVLSVPNSQEHRGSDFLAVDLGLGGTWIQTSFTSRGGQRFHPYTGEYLGDNHFRFNFAAPGYIYDGARDAFIPPQPSENASFDEASCTWIVPDDGVVEESPNLLPPVD